MQINRLFEIVYVLLQQKTVTAKELSERFGVSQRTIYRDIDILSLTGIPVYTEKGKGGGIGLLSEFILNKSLLSEQEQMGILTALQGLSKVTPTESANVLQKMATIFNKNISNWVQVDFSDWSIDNSDMFNYLKVAILERYVVEFDYYNTSGEKMKRRIEPVQLWFKSRAWYVKGFCLTRQEIRLFKLVRVKNLVVTNELFPERNLQVLQPEDNQDKCKMQGITIKIRVRPEMAYKVFDDFNENAIEKQEDGSFLVTFECPEEWFKDDWIYGWLLSYAEYIDVLSPVNIQNVIKEKAQKIAKKYL